MNVIPFEKETPAAAVERLIARHGLRQVLLALVTLSVRPRPARPIFPQEMSDHLRRDVGLPPSERRPSPWDYL